jgi:hypothetical protein
MRAAMSQFKSGRVYQRMTFAQQMHAHRMAGAADLKFLQHLQQVRGGTSNRKAALES